MNGEDFVHDRHLSILKVLFFFKKKNKTYSTCLYYDTNHTLLLGQKFFINA